LPVRTKGQTAAARAGAPWPAVRVDDWRSPALAADGLRELVTATLSGRAAEPGRALARAFLAADDIDAAALRASTAVTVLLGWLVGAREHADAADSGADADVAGADVAGADAAIGLGPAAVDWVRANLGDDEAGQALTLAGALDHPLAPQLTMADAVERLGDALLPALLWLVAGLTATAGAGDPDWLGRFEP
jgi:hypothetical protein